MGKRDKEQREQIAAMMRDALETAPVGRRRKGFLVAFNESMGCFAISRQTLYRWERGAVLPDGRILAHAVTAYPAGDWRRELAEKMLTVAG